MQVKRSIQDIGTTSTSVATLPDPVLSESCLHLEGSGNTATESAKKAKLEFPTSLIPQPLGATSTSATTSVTADASTSLTSRATSPSVTESFSKNDSHSDEDQGEAEEEHNLSTRNEVVRVANPSSVLPTATTRPPQSTPMAVVAPSSASLTLVSAAKSSSMVAPAPATTAQHADVTTDPHEQEKIQPQRKAEIAMNGVSSAIERNPAGDQAVDPPVKIDNVKQKSITTHITSDTVAAPTGTDAVPSKIEGQLNQPSSQSVSTLSSIDSSGKRDVGPLSSANSAHLSAPAAVANIAQHPPPAPAATTKAKLPPSTLQKIATPPPPLKSTKMVHLRKKYMAQLEYMHREFKKLERQLLGAKTTAKNITESAGSKERREKLHSFIVHLEDTMNQIQIGCSLENEGKSTLGVAVTSSGGAMMGGNAGTAEQNASNASAGNPSDIPQESTVQAQADKEEAKKEFARSSALTKLTKEKEEEENVQKLEEHILANLLPVKERLTKQLAAQHGAKCNPATMPMRGNIGLNAKGKTVSIGGTSVGVGIGSNADQRLVGVHHARQPRITTAHSPPNPPISGPVPGPAAHSQFGKPLQLGASMLTQKLHGKTLGSEERAHGHGVGINTDSAKNVDSNPSSVVCTTTSAQQTTVVYAGMTPGSTQVKSGVSAAAGVHDMVIENPRHQHVAATKVGVSADDAGTPAATPPPPPPPTSFLNPKINTRVDMTAASMKATGLAPSIIYNNKSIKPAAGANPKPVQVKSATTVPPPPPGFSMTVVPRPTKKSLQDPTLTEEERREMKARKKIRKVEKRRVEMERQRQIVIHQQQQQQQLLLLQRQQASSGARRVTKPVVGNIRNASNQRKGPRTVEYICALCNETYKSTCDCNPWWALTSQECLKCGKTQIPRLDIAAPLNTIEYHPALLAHIATEESGKAAKQAVSVSASVAPKHYGRSPHDVDPSIVKGGAYSELNGSDEDFLFSDSDESDFGDNMSPSAQAENEDFGKDYSGPKFSDYDASRLLTMMAHASTCPGRHKTAEASEVCRSIKYMMLHVRDCPGTTPSYDICPYPWCRKTKHLLYHLVSCRSPEKCKICTPDAINDNLKALQGLNNFRRQKQKERNATAMSSAANSIKSAQGKSRIGAPTNNSIMVKKNVQHRRVARGGIMATGTRVNKNPKIKPLNILVGPHTTAVGKKNPLSVPSPIPTIGLSSVKPTNPLAHGTQNSTHRPNAVSKQTYGAANAAKFMVPSSTVKSTKPILSNQNHVQTDKSKTKAPANPLTVMQPATSYVPPKTSPPPNPLKVITSEQVVPTSSTYARPTTPQNLQKKTSTTAPTTQQQFPSLPNHISVVSSGTGDTNSAVNPMVASGGVKIKVEGNQ